MKQELGAGGLWTCTGMLSISTPPPPHDERGGGGAEPSGKPGPGAGGGRAVDLHWFAKHIHPPPPPDDEWGGSGQEHS